MTINPEMNNKGIIQEQIGQILNAGSIAVVGTSRQDDSPSNLAIKALKSSLKSHIYPVNPNVGEILGLKAYPDLQTIPENIDIVYISVSSGHIIDTLKDCVQKGVKGIIINSAGFNELGTEKGLFLKAEVKRRVEGSGIRIIGPNCLGFYRPGINMIPIDTGEVPELSDDIKREGPVSLISQSGWFCGFFMYQCMLRGGRFSTVISSGNEIDIDFIDLMEYLGKDPATSVISVYMEGIRDAVRFKKVASEIVPQKPILILKGGRTRGGASSAMSHTGSLTGDFEIFVGLCRQIGAQVVFSERELIDKTVTFALCPVPKGNRVAILSGVGGAAVKAVDECSKHGLKVPEFSESTRKRLEKLLPSFASSRNPVDLTMMVMIHLDMFWESIKIIESSGEVDSIILHTGGNQYEESLAPVLSDCQLPLLVVSPPYWTKTIINGPLAKVGIPTFCHAEDAVSSLAALVQYRRQCSD